MSKKLSRLVFNQAQFTTPAKSADVKAGPHQLMAHADSLLCICHSLKCSVNPDVPVSEVSEDPQLTQQQQA